MKDLKFEVNKIINPILTVNCSSRTAAATSASASLSYELKMIDLASGEVLMTSSPSVDDRNCVNFVKELFDVKISGPTILRPGISHDFTIQLQNDRPAHNLIFYPTASITGIKFSP